jgi:hypothetical protein
MAVAAALDGADTAPRPAVGKTTLASGYRPSSLDDGLTRYVDWLRDLGRIDPP